MYLYRLSIYDKKRGIVLVVLAIVVWPTLYKAMRRNKKRSVEATGHWSQTVSDLLSRNARHGQGIFLELNKIQMQNNTALKRL